jgi:ABC-type phosphate transport system permease subunit
MDKRVRNNNKQGKSAIFSFFLILFSFFLFFFFSFFLFFFLQSNVEILLVDDLDLEFFFFRTHNSQEKHG